MKSQGCQNPYNPDFDAYIYHHIEQQFLQISTKVCQISLVAGLVAAPIIVVRFGDKIKMISPTVGFKNP
jgi:hypothetical protein